MDIRIRNQNAKVLGSFFNAGKKAPVTDSSYSKRELTRVRGVLKALGYTLMPEGAYADNDKFKDVLEDYVRFDDERIKTGGVTLHLDAGNKTGLVQDGFVDIVIDSQLLEMLGRHTTVSDFAERFKGAKPVPAVGGVTP